MRFKALSVLAALGLVVSAYATAPIVYEGDVDLTGVPMDHGGRPQWDIPVKVGNTGRVRLHTYWGTNVYNPSSMVVTFHVGPTRNDAGQIEIACDEYTSYVDFTFSTSNLAIPMDRWYSALRFASVDGSEVVSQPEGLLSCYGAPEVDGGSVNLTYTRNWALWNYLNTTNQGPYRFGSGWLTSTNADGSANILSAGTTNAIPYVTHLGTNYASGGSALTVSGTAVSRGGANHLVFTNDPTNGLATVVYVDASTNALDALVRAYTNAAIIDATNRSATAAGALYALQSETNAIRQASTNEAAISVAALYALQSETNAIRQAATNEAEIAATALYYDVAGDTLTGTMNAGAQIVSNVLVLYFNDIGADGGTWGIAHSGGAKGISFAYDGTSYLNLTTDSLSHASGSAIDLGTAALRYTTIYGGTFNGSGGGMTNLPAASLVDNIALARGTNFLAGLGGTDLTWSGTDFDVASTLQTVSDRGATATNTLTLGGVKFSTKTVSAWGASGTTRDGSTVTNGIMTVIGSGATETGTVSQLIVADPTSLGSELIVNGGVTSAYAWTVSGASYQSSGTYADTFVIAAGTTGVFYQTTPVALTTGSTYRTSLTIYSFGDSVSSVATMGGYTNTQTVTATETFGKFHPLRAGDVSAYTNTIIAGANYAVYVDNFSIKKVTQGDGWFADDVGIGGSLTVGGTNVTDMLGAAATTYQPLDADLTDLADGNLSWPRMSNGVFTSGAVLLTTDIGSSVQAYDADLGQFASVTPTADGLAFVSSPSYASMRTLLDVEPGTDFLSVSAAQALTNGYLTAVLAANTYQPLDADLTTLATPGNWKVIYTDGSGNITQLSLGAAGQVLTANGAAVAPTFEDVTGGADLGAVAEFNATNYSYPCVWIPLDPDGDHGWTDFEIKFSTNNFTNLVYYYISTAEIDLAVDGDEIEDNDPYVYFTISGGGTEGGVTYTDPRRWYKQTPFAAIYDMLTDQANGVVGGVEFWPSHNGVEYAGWSNSCYRTNVNLVGSYQRIGSASVEQDGSGNGIWRPVRVVGWYKERRTR